MYLNSDHGVEGSVNWNPCLIQDLLSAADEIQKMAETTLGGKFETVVALDDFAYKSHFKVGFCLLLDGIIAVEERRNDEAQRLLKS